MFKFFVIQLGVNYYNWNHIMMIYLVTRFLFLFRNLQQCLTLIKDLTQDQNALSLQVIMVCTNFIFHIQFHNPNFWENLRETLGNGSQGVRIRKTLKQDLPFGWVGFFFNFITSWKLTGSKIPKFARNTFDMIRNLYLFLPWQGKIFVIWALFL